MIFKQVDNSVKQIDDFGEILEEIKKINGANIYIACRGDRKSLVKFRSLLCLLTNDGTEKCLLMVEDIDREEDCQEIYLNPKTIESIEVLEWEETDELEGFYLVVKLKTGNELHIQKCVA